MLWVYGREENFRVPASPARSSMRSVPIGERRERREEQSEARGDADREYEVLSHPPFRCVQSPAVFVLISTLGGAVGATEGRLCLSERHACVGEHVCLFLGCDAHSRPVSRTQPKTGRPVALHDVYTQAHSRRPRLPLCRHNKQALPSPKGLVLPAHLPPGGHESAR